MVEKQRWMWVCACMCLCDSGTMWAVVKRRKQEKPVGKVKVEQMGWKDQINHDSAANDSSPIPTNTHSVCKDSLLPLSDLIWMVRAAVLPCLLCCSPEWYTLFRVFQWKWAYCNACLWCCIGFIVCCVMWICPRVTGILSFHQLETIKQWNGSGDLCLTLFDFPTSLQRAEISLKKSLMCYC